MSQVPTSNDRSDTESGPILFHDGCATCLEVARTLKGTIPGLTVINLARLRQFGKEARERGVKRLPSLVVGDEILAIAPHSRLDDIA